MKNNILYYVTGLLYLVLMAAVLTSCIKEDNSDCPVPVVSVIFTDLYYDEAPDQGLNTGEFSHVTLFLYNQDKQRIATTVLYECRLDQEYKLDMKLSPGSYEFVAWVGTEDFFYNFQNTDDLEKASLNLYIPESHLVDFWISDIYFGRSSFTVETKDKTVQVPVIQLTNEINFTVEGLGEEDHYTFTIADNNGKYNFNGSYMPCEQFGYQSELLLFRGNLFDSHVTILRLTEERTPMLFLTDDTKGELLYPSYEGQDFNLVSLIKKAYNTNSFDFDSRHIFNLSLVFDADMRATVYIDDWLVKDDNYEL